MDVNLFYDTNIENAFFHVWDFSFNLTCRKWHSFKWIKIPILQRYCGIYGTQNYTNWSFTNWYYSYCYPKFPLTIRYHRSSIMVWAHQSSRLGIFNQPYYSTIRRASQSQFKIYVEQYTHTNFENSKQILVNKVKEGIQSFDGTQKSCYWLVQRGHGLSPSTTIL